MRDAASDWSKELLLAFAADRGRIVTAEQFDRWRKRGLLPSPVLRGRGQGLGMQASYPESAGPQLIAVADQLAKNRSVRAALWRVWWDGFPIDEGRIRPLLESALTQLEHVGAVGDRLNADESGTFLPKFEAASSARVKSPHVGRIRRRLGKARFASFSAMLHQLAAGTYESNDRGDAALLAKGLGVGATPLLGPEAFVAMSRLIRPSRLRTALTAAQPGAVSAARDELKILIERLMPFVLDRPERLFDAPVDARLGAALSAGLNDLQPDLVLLWLPLRAHPSFVPLFQFFTRVLLRPFEEWAERQIPTLTVSP